MESTVYVMWCDSRIKTGATFSAQARPNQRRRSSCPRALASRAWRSPGRPARPYQQMLRGPHCHQERRLCNKISAKKDYITERTRKAIIVVKRTGGSVGCGYRLRLGLLVDALLCRTLIINARLDLREACEKVVEVEHVAPRIPKRVSHLFTWRKVKFKEVTNMYNLYCIWLYTSEQLILIVTFLVTEYLHINNRSIRIHF